MPSAICWQILRTAPLHPYQAVQASMQGESPAANCVSAVAHCSLGLHAPSGFSLYLQGTCVYLCCHAHSSVTGTAICAWAHQCPAARVSWSAVQSGPDTCRDAASLSSGLLAESVAYPANLMPPGSQLGSYGQAVSIPTFDMPCQGAMRFHVWTALAGH